MEKFKTGASILTASIAIAFLSHCSPKKADEAAIVQLLDEGMIIAQQVLNYEVREHIEKLRKKLEKLSTKERAERWYPKASEIHDQSQKMYGQIQTLKSELLENADKKSLVESFSDNDKINSLYDSLWRYKQEILKIDTLLEYTFSKEHLVLISNDFDSGNNTQKNLSSFFANITLRDAISILNRIQFNILNNERKLIAFCNEQVIEMGFYFDVYSAIIAQSSNYVRAGESLEIIAGIGAFSRKAKPVVTVMNKTVPIGDEGTAKYSFKAPRKPGKHAVPVKINFIDEIGMPQEIIKNVEYTVAKEQD